MKNKLNLILIFLCVVFGVFYITERNLTTEYTFSQNIEKLNIEDIKNIDTNEMIVIDIKGEVKNPDLYILPKDSNLKDAVDMAGGLTENANKNNLDMERKLQNKEKINIDPKSIEIENIEVNKNNLNLININTADKETLKMLPKVGDVIAENIIKYREQNGGFKDISELKNVNRIGDKIFEEIKHLITI